MAKNKKLETHDYFIICAKDLKSFKCSKIFFTFDDAKYHMYNSLEEYKHGIIMHVEDYIYYDDNGVVSKEEFIRQTVYFAE